MKSKRHLLVSIICGLICSNGSSFASQGISDLDSNKKIVLDDNIENLKSNISAKLNMSKDMQERPVFHRISFGDTLSGLAQRYYENGNSWNVIAEYPANQKVVRDGGNTIREFDYLSIPQPTGANWVLYNPPSGSTFTSVSRDFYGSGQWGSKLKEYNNGGADNIYDDVIKLPKELYSGDYVTDYNDVSLYSLCCKLFGSTEYVQKVADFNNLNPNEPLRSGKLIHIPGEILLNSQKK